MKSSNKRSGRPKAMLLSKLNAASSGVISSARVIPTIRIVQISPPQIFKTDPANFLALVQQLTGKKPAAKKLTGTVGSKKKKKKKSIVRAQSAANHSQALPTVDEHSFPKEVSENQCHVMGPLAGIERDSVEEDGVQVCDSFSEPFCDLEKLDFLSTLQDSYSILPESPMSYPPVAEHIDYYSTIFETLKSDEFSHFYQ